MIRSLLRQALGPLAGAALAGLAVIPAQGAQITLSDSSCDSFSLSGAAPNQTLTCVVSNAPTGCSISGPSTGTVGTPITLTAVCQSGSANGWTWTGGSCVGVTTQSCAASDSLGQTTYQVTPRNAIGNGNQASLLVTWSNTPPAPPSGCTLAANPSSMTASGSVTLTAACTGGAAPTSWAWTGAGAVTPTNVNNQIITVGATTTFSVTPSNGGGNGNTAQAIVTVGAPPPPAGAACTVSGQSYAVVDAGVLGMVNPVSTVGVSSQTVAVATLQVPSGFSTKAGSTIQVYASNNGSGTREVWMSKTRCDMPGAIVPTIGQTTLPGTVFVGPSQNIYYTIGGSDPNSVNMVAGETWYLHVISKKINSSGIATWCTTGCNFGMTWNPPPQ